MGPSRTGINRLSFARGESDRGRPVSLAELPEDLTFNPIGKAGKDLYPITGVIYAVFGDRQSEGNRKQIVRLFTLGGPRGPGECGQDLFCPAAGGTRPMGVDRRLDVIKVLRPDRGAVAREPETWLYRQAANLPDNNLYSQVGNGESSAAETYFSASPYIKRCGTSCNVALPSLNLMIHSRS